MSKGRNFAVLIAIAAMLLPLLAPGSARGQDLVESHVKPADVHQYKKIEGAKIDESIDEPASIDLKIVKRLYRKDRPHLVDFFGKYFEVNDYHGRYEAFTKRFKDGGTPTFSTYVTDIEMPYAYVFFANKIEHAFAAVLKDTGRTFIDQGKIDNFFSNYFKVDSNKTNTKFIWDVDNAYTAFKKDFPRVDYTWFTESTFRDYTFMPALLRYVANDTVESMTGVDHESAVRVRPIE